MKFDEQMIEELNMLSKFNLDSMQSGIKVHSSAEASVIDATRRLFEKALITQEDGGYLTSLGMTAAQHAQDLLQILQVD